MIYIPIGGMILKKDSKFSYIPDLMLAIGFWFIFMTLMSYIFPGTFDNRTIFTILGVLFLGLCGIFSKMKNVYIAYIAVVLSIIALIKTTFF